MRLRIFALTLFLGLGIISLSAQSYFNLDTDNKNQLYFKAGVQPNVGYRLGYIRNFSIGQKERRISLYGELQGSFIRNLDQNAAARLGGVFPVLHQGKWKLFSDLFFTAGHLETTHFTSNRFTVGEEIDFGFYNPKWRMNLSLGYQWIYLSQITHTDFYRNQFYEDAVDGWYEGNGGFFLLGLETSWLIRKQWDVGLSFKVPFSEQFNSLGGAPANMSMDLGWRF